MNIQEMFNTVAIKLHEQGGRSYAQGLGCRYRNPSNGWKCAIGHLISDDEYRPEFESHRINNILAGRTNVFVGDLDRFVPYIQFLSDLQSAHDTGFTQGDKWDFSYPERSITYKLKEVASKYNLDATVVDNLWNQRNAL